jgi:hypothetical protein
MLRRFSRVQRSHDQERRPRSTPADQLIGGGSLGAAVPQAEQLADAAGTPWAGTIGWFVIAVIVETGVLGSFTASHPMPAGPGC